MLIVINDGETLNVRMQFTRGIEKALVDKRGWEGYLKRGAHTLTCPEYQVSPSNSNIHNFCWLS